MARNASELLETIQNDQSKALRAEKTVEGEKALTGEPRTAIRYLGETEHGQSGNFDLVEDDTHDGIYVPDVGEVTVVVLEVNE